MRLICVSGLFPGLCLTLSLNDMWVLLPPLVRLGLITLTSIGLGLTWAWIDGDFSAFRLSFRMLTSLSLLVVIGTALGKWTKISWTKACEWGLWRWYPNLNGTWHGKLISTHQENGEPKEIDLEVTIDQRWGSIKVISRNTSLPEEAKSRSRGNALFAIPELRNGEVLLWTIYEGSVDDPEATDDDTFYGTTRMSYDKTSKSLVGRHWTNRAWRTGMNTAGSFSLSRL